ncbi:MAG: hypothetical protein H6Q49_1110 [Deltaproteobacteria bacterium]|nr:hypothetical protein [Deltaproteobacteria bacterium]
MLKIERRSRTTYLHRAPLSDLPKFEFRLLGTSFNFPQLAARWLIYMGLTFSAAGPFAP